MPHHPRLFAGRSIWLTVSSSNILTYLSSILRNVLKVDLLTFDKWNRRPQINPHQQIDCFGERFLLSSSGCISFFKTRWMIFSTPRFTQKDTVGNGESDLWQTQTKTILTQRHKLESKFSFDRNVSRDNTTIGTDNRLTDSKYIGTAGKWWCVHMYVCVLCNRFVRLCFIFLYMKVVTGFVCHVSGHIGQLNSGSCQKVSQSQLCQTRIIEFTMMLMCHGSCRGIRNF